MKQLTIIIPHYNNPNLLKKLLDSIPLMNEIEVIVVDDKSNKYLDEYYELTKSEKYENVIFMNNDTKKKGAGVSRNIGIDNATGKWLLFADSDDYFVPGFYSIIKEYFLSTFDVIFFKLTSVYVDTGQVADRHMRYDKLINDYLLKKDRIAELALRYFYASPCGKMIKKEFIEKNKIRFDEVIAANDVMFSTKVGYFMKSYDVSAETIYCATRGKGSLTTNIDEKIFDSRLQVFIDYYKYLQKRLTKDEFEMLNINGRGKIIDVVRYRLGFKKLFFVIRELRKNKIKLLEMSLFNPLLIIKKLLYFRKKFDQERKYLGN